jgi:hypothetical protein
MTRALIVSGCPVSTQSIEYAKSPRDERSLRGSVPAVDGPYKRNEDGAILLLALVFILLISFSILGLLTFGGTGIKDAADLQGQRSLEYAADGATTAAIQAVRYSYQAYSGSPADCLPGGTTMMIPEDGTNYTMTVDCVGTVEDSPAPEQYSRAVTFYACTQSACSDSDAIVAATGEFQDLSPTTGIDACDDAHDVGTCGTGMVIDSWIVKNVDT